MHKWLGFGPMYKLEAYVTVRLIPFHIHVCIPPIAIVAAYVVEMCSRV